MKIKSFIAVLVLFAVVAAGGLCGAAEGAEKEDSAKTKDIRRLLSMTNSTKMTEQMVKQTIESMKSVQSQLPEKFWQDLIKEMDAAILIDEMIHVYDKYLTHEEIRDVIRFYESPSGKKLIEIMPQIMKETMAVGQQWGMKINKKVMEELEKSRVPKTGI